MKELAAEGYRSIAIARGQTGEPVHFAGIAALFDPPREDARQVIDSLKEMGVSILLLTGDALPIATEIATKTGIGNRMIKASALHEVKGMVDVAEQYDGIAEVYPEDKYQIVKTLQDQGHIVGMTGDGVNDAPALKQAEVGVAVNNAADVAKSSASIILTQDGLQGLLSPVRMGRVMFERFNLWMLNKLSRTILKVCFIVLALILFGKYVVSTTALLLMLLITDFVFISTSNDKVEISRRPVRWDIPALAMNGLVQGLLMSVEALGLLAIGWHYFDLDADPGRLYTFCYLILFFYTLTVVFVIREKRHFWSSRPGRLDTVMLLLNYLVGIAISFTGLVDLKPLPFHATLLILGYVLFTSLIINDYIKYLIYRKKGKKDA